LLILVGSLAFIVLGHPISIGVVLILHTLIVGVLTGILSRNFWFSYILFLVFLGGVLVLFVYITRLASNEKFGFSWTGLFILSGGIFVISLCTIFIIAPTSGAVTPVEGWLNFGSIICSSSMMILKLYRSESYIITSFLILYLLFALVVCANLVGGYPGALRNFN
jgi:NADH-ubiquinone oxidoreductase chain 6